VRVALPVVLLAAVTAATFATLPVLRDAFAAVPVTVGTPVEAIAAGAGSGQLVRLTAVIDDARRMRSPQRGAPAWYAPVADSKLLVRTDDPERLRLRPLTLTGQMATLGALAEDPRLLAAMRDGRGAPLAADTPVLVERGLLATALLTGLALLVAWATALASVWLLRWEGTRSPDLRLVKPEPQQDDLAG
jgi:hypothetical protein